MSDDEDGDGALNTASALADESSDKRSGAAFLLAFLNCVYNRAPPANTKSSDDIKHFIDKVKDVLPVMSDPGKIMEKMNYPASSFLRSAAVTMATAMKRHYRKGSQELAEKTRILMDKGHPPADTLSRIDSSIPAIENSVRLNNITGNRRKILPMSSMEDRHICLSELDLIAIFWKDKDLRELLQILARPEFPSTPHPSLGDMYLWISDKKPGYLVTTILTDVGGYSEEQHKKQRGYWRSTMETSVQEMRHHLEDIREKDFSPAYHSKCGYVLAGQYKRTGPFSSYWYLK
ncbi:hypothetical protein BG011_007516 [Mortierella polycephala]|uniref:Uncharacterized protein n=1 Tax=Mortierella polycephala TaxID=41804 RepID=A0A9P6TYK5_9FUNG|nr:hypothetical protein BG011_007516 [Mortierella polycephala]